MRRIVLALLIALTMGAAATVAAQPSATVGLVFPESVYFDAATESWFVSNFGPSPEPGAKDDDGFISRLDDAGQVVAERWVDGLGSPKGMRTHDGKLYVADVDTLVVIDVDTATITDEITLPGANILNDVDLDDDGNAYVTDWTGNRIYKVAPDGTPEVFLDTEKLEAPNGILVEGDTLTIAAWGTNINPDLLFTTDEPGRVLQVDIATQEITPLGSGERIAGLDGIERDGDSYLATDWAGGRLLRVQMDGSWETVMQLGPSAADLGFDPDARTVGVPIFFASTAVFDAVEG